ncbi:hypothetical protein VHEMI08832 [[Torrubiella] hemipterigena]|uniref:EXPERA domain-containing protein n=1 Tax=[Torrubiella] hemipterigena TaxID=1531966 RepID=A0A0A1TER6_9HYPO|nr:hypothetical protein VHEMI08832 [[Torrubiella] hemipterigena]
MHSTTNKHIIAHNHTPIKMQSHPYYPQDAVIPGFVANKTPLIELLCIFGNLVSTIIFFTYVCCSVIKPPIPSFDQFATAWFALCGVLHLTFEGFFILYKETIASKQGLFGQLWKEYALSDSRYLTQDVFTISVETITVFCWGPLCLITASSILSRSPSRHFYQVIVCTAHLYGVALYYFTNWVDFSMNGISYSRPETLYYWVYYVGFNMPWVVVPLILLVQSWSSVAAGFKALKKQELEEQQELEKKQELAKKKELEKKQEEEKKKK